MNLQGKLIYKFKEHIKLLSSQVLNSSGKQNCVQWKFVCDQIILVAALSTLTVAVLFVQLSEAAGSSSFEWFCNICGEKNNIIYRTENQELLEGRHSIKLYLQIAGVSPEIRGVFLNAL